MHNKLRRAIELQRSAIHNEPHEKIMAQQVLLDRALVALGGPVQEHRNEEVTENDKRPSNVTITYLPVDYPEEVLPLVEAIIGNDPGDESEYAAGLGHDPK